MSRHFCTSIISPPATNHNTKLPITINAPWSRRIAIFAYGVASYIFFLGVFAYAVGFIGNFLVPTRLDGPATGPLWLALVINLGLFTLFALQHSVMARPAFKRWWTQYIPQPAERSTYVLATNIALLMMFWLWRPMGGTIWQVESFAAQIVLWSLFALGWLTVLVSTFLINHFDLLGLRQVTLYLLGKPYTELKFVTPGLYKLVRHPLYIGWFLVMWATPTMTAAHFVFALMSSAYILVAIQLEERDLIRYHGNDYAEYRRRVPMLIPRLRRRNHQPSVAPHMVNVQTTSSVTG